MRAEATPVTADILLLSDHESDIDLIRGAAGSGRLSVVSLCPDVLSYLRREGEYRDSPRPDLILLDLNLSNPDHCDTLRDIKNSPEFRRIPVVVLAAQSGQKSIEDAYSLHANVYIVKPRRPEEFQQVMKATLFFWLQLARLPKD